MDDSIHMLYDCDRTSSIQTSLSTAPDVTQKFPTSLAVCQWDKTVTLDPSVHILEHRLQPRHYFFASRAVQRSGIAARDVQYRDSGDLRHLACAIISCHCSGLLSELSDQICVGTANPIRRGADIGHAMARMRHVSNDGVIA
jgi:hypothetical protein